MRVDEAPLQGLSAAQRAALYAMEVPVYVRRRAPVASQAEVSAESLPAWSPEDWRLPIAAELARALRIGPVELRQRLETGQLRLPPPARLQSAAAKRNLWRQLRSSLRKPR